MFANSLNVRPLFEEAGPAREECSLGTLFDRSPLERATAGQIVFLKATAPSMSLRSARAT